METYFCFSAQDRVLSHGRISVVKIIFYEEKTMSFTTNTIFGVKNNLTFPPCPKKLYQL